MLLSVGIRSRQPESASDEWWWNYTLIINETNRKGQASCLTRHRSALSFTAEVLTTASTTAVVREFESSWLWNHQMWGWHWFCSTDLSCCFFAERRKKNCRESSTLSALWAAERGGKRGWLRGSGWIETRWNTGTADGQIFSAQSLHRVACSSLGDEHLLFNLTWPSMALCPFCFIENI